MIIRPELIEVVVEVIEECVSRSLLDVTAKHVSVTGKHKHFPCKFEIAPPARSESS